MVILDHIDTRKRERKKAKHSCTLFISHTYLLRLGNQKAPATEQAGMNPISNPRDFDLRKKLCDCTGKQAQVPSSAAHEHYLLDCRA